MKKKMVNYDRDYIVIVKLKSVSIGKTRPMARRDFFPDEVTLQKGLWNWLPLSTLSPVVKVLGLNQRRIKLNITGGGINVAVAWHLGT